MKPYHFLLPLLLFSLFQTGCSHSSPSPNSPTADSPDPTPADFTSEAPTERFPLLVSRDEGSSWQNDSFDLPQDLEVSFLEPMGDEIALATDNRGLFISQNNRTEWKAISEQLPGTKINALHISGQSIYVGVYRQGIFRTDDQGTTWTSLNYDLNEPNVQAILQLEDQLLIGTDFGAFYLPENEISWQPTSLKGQILSIYARGDKLVAGTSQGTALSEDGGEQWKWIRQEGAVHYTHPLGDRIVELVLNGELVVSDDWGEHWREMEFGPREWSYVYEIVEIAGVQLCSNNYGIHRSRDGGETWELAYPTESLAFFDLMVMGDVVYGGTRTWDEYRKRNN